MTYPEIIPKGATFYREVQLFSDKEKTQPVDLTSKTPRSSLMKPDGTVVAAFGCAVLGDRTEGRIAWTMGRAVTATLDYRVNGYFADIDLDDADGETTDRAYSNQVVVLPGQVPV